MEPTISSRSRSIASTPEKTTNTLEAIKKFEANQKIVAIALVTFSLIGTVVMAAGAIALVPIIAKVGVVMLASALLGAFILSSVYSDELSRTQLKRVADKIPITKLTGSS